MEYEPRTMGREIEYGLRVTQRGRIYDGADENIGHLNMLADTVVDRYKPADIAHNRSFLENGARMYRDINAHPEYSSPETISLEELVSSGVAGDKIMLQSFINACTDGYLRGERRLLDRFQLFKSVRAGQSSWGCHENYEVTRLLMGVDRDQGHHIDRRNLGPMVGFMAIRPLVAGIGFVDSSKGRFLLAQKASLLNSDVHSDTVRAKPLINSRDVCFGNSDKIARVHVTGCDPTSPHVTVRSMGTTSLLFRLMEIDAVNAAAPRSGNVSPQRAPQWRSSRAWHKIAQGISADFSLRRAYDIFIDDEPKSATALDMHDIAAEKMSFLMENDLAGDEERWAFEDYVAVTGSLRAIVETSKTYTDLRERNQYRLSAYKKLRGQLDWADRLQVVDADQRSNPDKYPNTKNPYATERARLVNEVYDVVGTKKGPGLVLKRAEQPEARRWAPSELVRQRLLVPPAGRAQLRGDFVRLMADDLTASAGWGSLRFSIPSATPEVPANLYHIALQDSKAGATEEYTRLMRIAASKHGTAKPAA